MLFGNLRHAEAGRRRLLAHGRNQAGQMQNADTLFSENSLEIKILRCNRSSDFSRSVIPYTRSPHAEAGIRNVELMSVSPRAALRHIGAFKADVSGAELCFDKGCDRAAFHKLCHDKAGFSKGRNHIEHVALSACRLQVKQIAVVHRHAVLRCDAHAHAGYARRGIFAVFSDLGNHIGSLHI